MKRTTNTTFYVSECRSSRSRDSSHDPTRPSGAFLRYHYAAMFYRWISFADLRPFTRHQPVRGCASMRTISKHSPNCTISSAVIDYVIHSNLDEDVCWKRTAHKS